MEIARFLEQDMFGNDVVKIICRCAECKETFEWYHKAPYKCEQCKDSQRVSKVMSY